MPATRAGGLPAALATYAGIRALGLLVLALGAGVAGRDAHAVLVRWDAQWYAGIARDGYGLVREHPDGRLLADYAFFPLYPALERAVAEVTRLPLVDAGLLVSVVAGLVAAAGIHAVGTQVAGPRAGLVLVALWAALPVGIVTTTAYSEALFTAVAAWSLYAVLSGRWLLAGAGAAAAGLTRPLGVAVVVAVLVGAALAVRKEPTSWLRPALGCLLAPLGALAYLAWVGLRLGSPTGYFEVADGWGNGVDGGVSFVGWVADLATSGTVAGPLSALGTVAGVGVLLALLVTGVRQGLPWPLLAYAATVVVLAFVTSGYFGSKPRYLLPAFPLLLPVAVVLARSARRTQVLVIGALVVGSAAYGAAWLLGPGPL